MSEQIDRRRRFIDGLRELAIFMETHPDVEAPAYSVLNVFVHEREELARMAAGASWEKVYMDDYFVLRRSFAGDDIQLDLTASRDQVCRKVVKGMRIIPATPEHEVEDVEWVCDEPLLGGAR